MVKSKKTVTHFKNISQALTLQACARKSGVFLETKDLDVISNASIISDDKNILWVGKSVDLPKAFYKKITKEVDCKNSVATPALVDSHTHLVFSGSRSNEFVMRLEGRSYESIAKAGGGISYTSNLTNESTDSKLLLSASQHLKKMSSLGVGVCEIKTGYSLKLEGELRLLNIINTLRSKFSNSIHIHRTLMSAHSVDSSMNKDNYVNNVVIPSIVSATKSQLLDSVDIFHEKNYFDEVDAKKIFSEARKLGVSCKIHADELNDNNGALLAAKYGCLSADHLLESNENGARAMAKANVVATLLPGTAFFLGKKLANAKMFLDAGCSVAIASDFNPGSCCMLDVFQIARMSAPTLKLNPAVFWASVTFNGAKALGLSHEYGALMPGYRAKILCWDATDYKELLYDWTLRPKCWFPS